ncbi:14154_t:CDS:2, partial [Acaulospora morrowiae]
MNHKSCLDYINEEVGECSTTRANNADASNNSSHYNCREKNQNLINMGQKLQQFYDEILSQKIMLSDLSESNIREARECIEHKRNPNVMDVDSLIENIQSNKRSPRDYYMIKYLLDKRPGAFSNNDLRRIIVELCKPSIYEDHVEMTTILLELNLRALLSAIQTYKNSGAIPTRKYREEIFGKLAEFANFHFSNSNSALNIIKKDSQSVSEIFAEVDIDITDSKVKRLLRNNNIDFLLTVLRDTVHDMEDDKNVSAEVLRKTYQVTTLLLNSVPKSIVPINIVPLNNTETSLLGQLRNISSSRCKWYSKWKQLMERKENLFKSILENDNIDFQESQERELLEELWLYGSVEWSNQCQDIRCEMQETCNARAQDLNALLGNEPLIHLKSLWFGTLDIAQELITWTQSVRTLVIIYYFALQSLLHARETFIRSKAIEILITLSCKHTMLFSEFESDFEEFLKGLRSNGTHKQKKYNLLFCIIKRRYQFYPKMANEFQKLQLKKSDVFSIPLKIISNEITCPITQDLSENFQILPCGHYVSEEGAKGWTEECKNNNKLFSCCICRTEFKFKEVEDAPSSCLRRDLYLYLDSIGYISRQKTIMTFIPPAVIIGASQNSSVRIRGLGFIKKCHPAYRSAEVALKNENFELAIYWLGCVLNTWPDSYSVRCKRGWALQQMGDFHQAITDLNISAHLKPLKTKAWRLLANLYSKIGIYELALPHISRALELDQKNLHFLLIRGTIYIKLRQYEHAFRDFNVILEFTSKLKISTRLNSTLPAVIEMIRSKNTRLFQPKNKSIVTNTLIKRSQLYYEQSEYDLAEKDLDMLLQWDGNNFEGIILRGRIFYRINQYRAAISNYNRAIAIDHKNEYAFNLRAWAKTKLGDFDQAIKDSDYALKLNPRKGYSYRFRSMILQEMDQFEAALDYISAAYAIDNVELDHYYQLLDIYCDTHQYWNAIYMLSDIIDSYKKEIEGGDMYYVNALIQRGMIYSVLQNEEEKAFEDFRVVLKIDPKNDIALSYRGGLYARLRNFEMAMKDINAAIKIESNAYRYQDRAYVYYKMGNYDLALQDLDASERFDSEAAITLRRRAERRMTCLYRGIIYHKLREYEKSLENIDEAITILHDDEIIISLVERASVYVSTNRLGDALNDLKKAFVIEPKHVYMSKALAKGIKLYGTIYKLHSQSTSAINWIALHEQHSLIPQLTLNKLKEEIGDMDGVVEGGNELV